MQSGENRRTTNQEIWEMTDQEMIEDALKATRGV